MAWDRPGGCPITVARQKDPRSLRQMFPKLGGTVLGVPIISEDYSFGGSMLGSPYLGKLPNCIKSGQQYVEFFGA